MSLVVVACLLIGLVFFTGGAIGILRFPDFYSRLHPAGKMDTLASVLMVSGLALYNLHHMSIAAFLTSTKMVLIAVFIFLASPTATHAIVDAGLRAGLRPWKKGEKRR